MRINQFIARIITRGGLAQVTPELEGRHTGTGTFNTEIGLREGCAGRDVRQSHQTLARDRGGIALSGDRPFGRVTNGALNGAYAGNHRFQFIGLKRGLVIGPWQHPVQCEMLFDGNGTARDRGGRNGNALTVVGKANRKPKGFCQCIHRRKVDRLRRGRVIRCAMKKGYFVAYSRGARIAGKGCGKSVGRRRTLAGISEREDAKRGLHFVKRCHAGRQNDRLVRPGEMQKQRRIG